MPLPPPELIWISIIASLIAITWQLANLAIAWRNRARLTFKTISASVYTDVYLEWELNNAYWAAPHERPFMKPGDCKTAFVVIEFAVTNHYPTEMAVGRFIIGGWMFSDHYTRGMYHFRRDYQVFDLNTRTRTSLDTFVRIPPKGSLGYRIEILEQADGPSWVSSHSRYVVDVPKLFDVHFHTSVGEHRSKIRLPRRSHIVYGNLPNVYHWSTLLETVAISSTGAPVPQGIESPYSNQTHWLFKLLPKYYFFRFRNWYTARLNKIANVFGSIRRPKYHD